MHSALCLMCNDWLYNTRWVSWEWSIVLSPQLLGLSWQQAKSSSLPEQATACLSGHSVCLIIGKLMGTLRLQSCLWSLAHVQRAPQEPTEVIRLKQLALTEGAQKDRVVKLSCWTQIHGICPHAKLCSTFVYFEVKWNCFLSPFVRKICVLASYFCSGFEVMGRVYVLLCLLPEHH